MVRAPVMKSNSKFVGSSVPSSGTGASRRTASPSGTAAQARRNLKNGGWTLRGAALVLGISHSHLSRVLSGYRKSRVLIRRSLGLPPHP